MKFAPDWVLELTCGYIAVQFVTGHMPLQAYTKRFSKDLLLKYDDASSKKIEKISEDMLFFLATFECDDHMEIIEAFMFNVINFDKNGKERKFKTMFTSALSAEKNETSGEDALKHFTTFVYQLRNNPKLFPSDLWKLTDTKDIDELLKIYAQPVRVLDAF